MAKKFKTTKELYAFKKGDTCSLDSIYAIQGIGGNDWWEHSRVDAWGDENDEPDPDAEKVVITRDITISISVKKGI